MDLELVKVKRDDGAEADIRQEWVDEWVNNGWTVVDPEPQAARRGRPPKDSTQ